MSETRPYYPVRLRVENAGLFDGRYDMECWDTRDMPRYISRKANAVRDFSYIYRTRQGEWCFAVGGSAVRLDIGGYWSFGCPYAPHLASIRWRENLGDGKWQPAPDLSIVDESDHCGDTSISGVSASDSLTEEDAGASRSLSSMQEPSVNRTVLPATLERETRAATSVDPPPNADLTLRFGDGPWTVQGVLVDLELAKSLSDAGKMIRAGLVRVHGRKVRHEDEGLDEHLRRGDVRVSHSSEEGDGEEEYDSDDEDAQFLSVYLTFTVTRLGCKTLRVREKRDGEDDANLYVWETLQWQGNRGKNFLRRA